jgi:hypothetical protein
MVIPTTILMEIIIRFPLILRTILKNLLICKKKFNAIVEEKLLKIDDLARNVDRISLEIDSLKIRSMPPKHDINESLKAIKISIDECKERIARMRAKRDWFVKTCSSISCDNNDEDLKVIGVTPIESLFSKINLDKYGTGDESTLARRRPNDSEFLDLNAKIDKSGIGEVKTLSSDEPTLLDFKDFNYH